MPPRRALLLAPLLFATLPRLAAGQARPADASGARPAADPGSALVEGVVFDSVRRVPLSGALVQLVQRTDSRAAYSAVTDSTGSYRIARVRVGPYLAGFLHPTLDSLGLQPPVRQVEVVPLSITMVNLAVRSPATIAAALCPNAPKRDSTGLILGYVRDASTGSAIAGSIVSATWLELVIEKRGIRQDRRTVTGRSSAEGWYRLCYVPSDAELLVRAEQGNDSSGFIEVVVPPRGLLKQDLTISRVDSVVSIPADPSDRGGSKRVQVRRGSARLNGSVRLPGGDPIRGAQVVVWGTGLEGTTNDAGAFTLAGLPAGTQSLEVRHIGYVPKRLAIDLAPGRATAVNVVMDDRAVVLAPVQVLGKRSPRSVIGFLERQYRGGFGRFITRADIQRQHAVYVTDILRTVPGVRVSPSGTFGYAVAMRGGCKPALYIDGMAFLHPDDDINTLVQPEDIAGMEVYTGLGGAPAEFPGNGCGSIVIWTGLRAR